MADMEYGAWSDEAGGFVERQLWSLAEASYVAAAHRHNGDDTARARALCEEHSDDEQPADACEDCLAEEG